MTGMEFLRKWMTEQEIAEMPAPYSAEDKKDPVAVVKFFTPDSSFTWYVLEAGAQVDEKTTSLREALEADSSRVKYVEAFALVEGLETELGYVDIDELARLRGKLGLPVERDLYWTPRPLSELRKG